MSRLALVAIVSFAVLAPTAAPAQERAPSPFAADEMARLMARYEELSTPGPGHERLEPFVGEWATTTRVWLGGPGSEPATSTGSAEIEWILGGRFLLERSEGVAEEQEYEGLGLLGFDNVAGEYRSVWVDSGNTAMYTSAGEWNEEAEALVLTGEREDPMTGEVGSFEYVRRVTDEDGFVFEIHDLTLGAKVVEITYERD